MAKVNWSKVGKKALVPLAGNKSYTPNLSGADIWAALGAIGMGASAYHGFKRNEAENGVAWALWWGFWGALIPIVTVPIAIAQGFGEPIAPAATSNGNNMVPDAAAGYGRLPL